MKTPVVLAAWIAAAALAAPARAQAPQPAPSGEAQPDPVLEARRQYTLGKAAYDAGRFTEAALAWEAAAAIKAHAATLFSAALAWERSNHPERAADDFGRALDVVPGLAPAETARAKERLGLLERALGTVLVTGPEGWRVQIDALTEVTLPARLHAMPGAHSILVRAPGQPIARRDLSLEVGKMGELDLSTPEAPVTPVPGAAPPVPAGPSPPPTGPSVTHGEEPRRGLDVRRSIGFGVVGMALATLGAGAVLGIEALGARDAYNAVPTRGGFDHAEGLQTWTNVAFVAGAVLAVGGVVLIVLPGGQASVSVTASPGGAGVRGTF